MNRTRRKKNDNRNCRSKKQSGISHGTYKTKNEYEEVTVRQQPYVHMHYRNIFDERDYDIYDPRYTRLKSSDWEAFRDPKKYWYTPYVNNRKKLAEEVENGFSLCASSLV